MKKITLLFLTVLLLFLLCGCYDHVDIEEKAMVAGFAVDLSENGYRVTAELVSSSGGSDSEIQSKIAYSEGKTLSECLRNMISESSKKLDFGHCKIIFISKTAAEQGIDPILDIIFHNDEIKVSIDLAVVRDNEAAAIFQTDPILSPIVSYEAQKTLESMSHYLSVSPQGFSYKALNHIASIGTELVLPMFAIRESEQRNSFYLNGCAYFKDDHLAGELTEAEGRYLQIIRGDFNKGRPTFTLHDIAEGGACCISPEITSFSGGSKPSPEDPYTIYVTGTVKLRMDELPQGISIETAESREKIEAEVQKEIEDSILTFTDKMLRQEKNDIFGFGRLIYHKDTALTKEVSTEEYMQKLTVKASFQVQIESSGISKKPLQD